MAAVGQVTQAEFWLPQTPPSMNTNKIRSDWRGFHNVKKAWQRMIEVELMGLALPRPIPRVGPLRADVVLTFPTKHRRDSENFRPVLSKALGDALVNGGWLADDTDEHWRLTLINDRDRGKATTYVRLRWHTAMPHVLRSAA